MTDTELAEYAGKKGLCADEISAWRKVCMNANGGSASETARLQRENRELERKLRSTERELARKEKVLAEVAALLVLGKKAGAVWGAGASYRIGDRTGPRRGRSCREYALVAHRSGTRLCFSVGLPRR